MSAYPVHTITTSAAAFAIAIGAGAAQAQGSSVSTGAQMQGQSVFIQRKAPAFAGPPVMAQPLSPFGPNTAATIIRPAVDPVPFSPAFPTSPQPAFVRPPVVINNAVIISVPPPVTEFPGTVMTGPQVPAISPSAPVLVNPPVQTIEPTDQTVIILPLGF